MKPEIQPIIADPSLCTLSGGDLMLKLDPAAATISTLSVRGQNLMVGRQGYVALEDRTTGQFHFKPEQRVVVEADESDGNIVFSQIDLSANLGLTQRFIEKDEGIEWSVEVETMSDDIREIHLHFVLPVFGADSHGFAAHAKFPMVPGTGNDHRMLVYGPNMFNEECFHCAMLPMVSVYNPQTDAGLAIIQPVDVAKPRMEYFFAREQPDLSLVVRWTHLRLVRGTTVHAKMLLAPIRGCWRDALQFIHGLYPDYFRVHEPSIFKYEGPMTCAELIPENQIDKLVQEQNLSWQEIHAYVFPRYGEYAPKEESWPNWVTHGKLQYFDLERLSRTEFRGMLSAITNKPEETISRQQINDYIDALHRKGVGVFLYINPVIASIDHLNDFPGSLATSADGTPLFRDYYREAPMNPAPGTSWRKHLDEMTDRMLDLFPGIDGFFLDELHWNQFDFSHNDGVSARGNRPVAMIGFAVQDVTKEICAKAHRRGKAIWANSPDTLEALQYVDGFMAERSWEYLGSVQYQGLEKPVVLLLSNDLNFNQLKDALDVALFTGAQPSVVYPPYVDTERIDLLQRYQVLFKMLRGRKWILHPHAVTIQPVEMRTNAFALPNGDFAIPVSRRCSSDYQLKTADGYAMDQGRNSTEADSSIKMFLQWPGLDKVQSARLFNSLEPEKPLDLKIQREQNSIALIIPPIDGGIIILSNSL